MLDKEPRLGLTYDDVVLVPAKSQVLPNEVDTSTMVTRNIRIHVPFVSVAMVKEAWPVLSRVPVPMVVAPSLKVTMPVGTPLPGALPVTVAVKVTA